MSLSPRRTLAVTNMSGNIEVLFKIVHFRQNYCLSLGPLQGFYNPN